MDVQENIKAGKYKNNVPYDCDTAPINPDAMTITQAAKHKEKQKELQRAQRRLHQEEEARLNALFRADLEAEHGLTGHPKANKLWDIAWDRGHSSGLSSVAWEYSDLAELVQP